MDLSLKFELSFHCLGPLKIPPAWQWNHCCGSAECRQCCGPLGRKHRRWYRGLLIPLFLALAFNVRCADRIIVPGAARDCDSQYPCSTGGSLGEILANIKQHLTIWTFVNMFLLSPHPYFFFFWYFEVSPSQTKLLSNWCYKSKVIYVGQIPNCW